MNPSHSAAPETPCQCSMSDTFGDYYCEKQAWKCCKYADLETRLRAAEELVERYRPTYFAGADDAVLRRNLAEVHAALSDAQAQLTALQQASDGLERDAARYAWLCDDLDAEQRAMRSHLLNRMSVMGKGAIDAAIDAALSIAAPDGEGRK